MKTRLLLLFCISALAVKAQNKVNPQIKNYGAVYEVPFAVEKPDPKMEYKIIVDITAASDKPDSLNESLEGVAKLVNLHALGNVPAKNLHVIVVIHNAAAYAVLNNELYKQRFKTDNPNLPLLTALKEAGVKIFICGQTLMKRNIDPKTIAPEVQVALSALTTLTTYQLKGYVLMKF